jgi:hypothetical protein
MSEIYLTIKEVADKLGYNPKSIQRYCRIKAIPCVRIKRSVRIPEKLVLKNIPKIEEMIEANKLHDDILEPEPIKPEIELNEVKEDMTKKKTVSTNTEIVASKPKVKAFTPNPNKAKKTVNKEVKEPDEYQDDNELDTDNDSPMDDSNNGDSDKDFLSDYKGIGNY